MKDLIIKNDNFVDIDFKTREKYNAFVKFNLKYADQIIFTTDFLPVQYEKLKKAVKDTTNLDIKDNGFCRAASDIKGQKSNLVEIENNYNLYEYLIDLGSIFAVNEEENLKDVCFLKAGEVYCYTVTHEEMCIMAGEEEKMFEKPQGK